MKKIGLALGAGGAKGISHIAFLKALDELGLRPAVIAGASIGAVIGAFYAAGVSGAGLEQLLARLPGVAPNISDEGDVFSVYLRGIDPTLNSVNIDGNKMATLTVGATVDVGSDQPKGLYSCSFDLTVDFYN